MGTLATVALAVLGISFMTFVAFFGRLPALRHTPIAWLHRAIWIYIPNGFLAIDQKFTSGKFTSNTVRLGRYLMYDKHPTILIFFFLLLSVSEYLFLPGAWPHMTAFHKSTGTVAIVLPYVFLYLSAFTDPGFITPANHAYSMALYPYDFTLFHPGTYCRTCQQLKPARSKHCSVCKRCISKLDHHCIFINNCVGGANQRWFLLLLLTTAILTVYGGLLGGSIMTAKMHARSPNWALLPWRANGGKGMTLHDWLVIWTWALQDGVGMGAVTMLALLTSPMVWGLLGYQLWLIYCGTTTNESMKWSDWQAEMDDGFAFKRRLPAGRPIDTRIEPALTRWPAAAEQILVRTESGRPPPRDMDIPGVGDWEPVWKLRDIENLYDLGFWDNLVDVFSPGYQFRDGHEPIAESQGPRQRSRPRK